MSASVIDNSENEENLISCSPADDQISDIDKSLILKSEKLLVAGDSIENDGSTDQQINDINITENVSDAAGVKQLDYVVEDDKKVDSHGLDSGNLCEGVKQLDDDVVEDDKKIGSHRLDSGNLREAVKHLDDDVVQDGKKVDSHKLDSGNLCEAVKHLDNDVVQDDKKVDSRRLDSRNLREGVSSSREMYSEAAIYSRHVTDKTPLLQDESSVTGSCSDEITEGENETSETTSCECSYLGDKDSDCGSLNNVSITSQTRESLMMPGSIRAPIVGHETVEARTKFTVYKIQVAVEVGEPGWFIFRRYSDFVHLNDQLKLLFPNFRLSLPPKRWFRSNFDSEFLEERLLGLQAFVDNVTGHSDICNSKPVKEFFCFDDPPGPHDSLEESRAQCECMEEMLYTLKNELTERDSEIQLLKEELNLYKNQVQLLSSRLSELNKRSSFERSVSEKHRSPLSVRQTSINAFLTPGDQLFTDKAESVNKFRSPELRRMKRLPSGDT